VVSGYHVPKKDGRKEERKNKSSVNPKSTSNQLSKPCTVLQYPSRKKKQKLGKP